MKSSDLKHLHLKVGDYYSYYNPHYEAQFWIIKIQEFSGDNIYFSEGVVLDYKTKTAKDCWNVLTLGGYLCSTERTIIQPASESEKRFLMQAVNNNLIPSWRPEPLNTPQINESYEIF